MGYKCIDFEKSKDMIFRDFVDCLATFRDRSLGDLVQIKELTYVMSEAIPFFPEDEQKELWEMIEVFSSELRHYELSLELKMYEIHHEKRAKKISSFLEKYNNGLH